MLQTGTLLACSAMNIFWIRWDDENIYFGKGSQVGEEQVLHLQDSDVTINAFSLASRHQQPAMWEFGKFQGACGVGCLSLNSVTGSSFDAVEQNVHEVVLC